MKKPSTWRILLYSLMSILLVMVVATVWGSLYMLGVSLGDLSGKDLNARRQLLLEESPEVVAWADSLREAQVMRDTFMTTSDGRRLHAVFAPADSSTKSTIVIVHGYTCNYLSSLKIARMLRDHLGLNIFMPDLHGHGLSDGDEVQMGWKDADDVMGWLPLVSSLFCDSTEARIVIDGVSMGAATTMNVSGKNYPRQVKCFIEDCGFSSVWDELSSELQNRYGLPPFPLMHTASYLCKLRYGWSFSEASPVEMVRRCKAPMLFIHGDSDDFVPTRMVYALYEAKPQPKQLWVTKDTDHAHSFRNHPEEYERRVRQFLESAGVIDTLQ